MPAILTNKSCGTCEYWGGERIACKGGARCNAFSDTAPCQHKTMSKTTPHAAHQQGCPKYVPWSQIG